MVAVCLHPTLPWVLTAGGSGVIHVRDYAKRRVVASRDVDLSRPARPGEYNGEEAEEGKKKNKQWRVGIECMDVSQVSGEVTTKTQTHTKTY